MRDDVRTAKEEGQGTLLDFVRRADARRDLINMWHAANSVQGAHPKLLRDRNSSGARFSCSHFVIVGPSRDEPPDKLSP